MNILMGKHLLGKSAYQLVRTITHVGWLVGCGLTSYSAIFQLYSEPVVQFPNFDMLPGTRRHGQLGVFSVPSLTSLPSEGAVRVCRESNPDLPIHSQARYLYATAADDNSCKRQCFGVFFFSKSKNEVNSIDAVL